MTKAKRRKMQMNIQIMKTKAAFQSNFSQIFAKVKKRLRSFKCVEFDVNTTQRTFRAEVNNKE